jgi:hypothetical protein
MVGFAVGATVMGIQLSKLEVELEATLDLAGFLDVRAGAPVAMSGIRYLVRAAGDGTREQFELLRRQAEAHSRAHHAPRVRGNSIAVTAQPPFPGDLELERELSAG